MRRGQGAAVSLVAPPEMPHPAGMENFGSLRSILLLAAALSVGLALALGPTLFMALTHRTALL